MQPNYNIGPVFLTANSKAELSALVLQKQHDHKKEFLPTDYKFQGTQYHCVIRTDVQVWNEIEKELKEAKDHKRRMAQAKKAVESEVVKQEQKVTKKELADTSKNSLVNKKKKKAVKRGKSTI